MFVDIFLSIHSIRWWRRGIKVGVCFSCSRKCQSVAWIAVEELASLDGIECRYQGYWCLQLYCDDFGWQLRDHSVLSVMSLSACVWEDEGWCGTQLLTCFWKNGGAGRMVFTRCLWTGTDNLWMLLFRATLAMNQNKAVHRHKMISNDEEWFRAMIG